MEVRPLRRRDTSVERGGPPDALVGRRAASVVRLLSLLVLLAIASGGVLGALVLLVGATGATGTRAALAAVPASRSVVDVRLVRPAGEARRATDLVRAAVRRSLDGLPVTTSTTGFSSALGVRLASGDAKTYFGELDSLRGAATLTSGAAPTPVHDGRVPVLLPAAAASLGLGTGSRFVVSAVSGPVTVEVTGLYRAERTDGPRWILDPLAGRGRDAAFPDPDNDYGPAGEGFGPLLVAPGALDAAGIGLSSLDVAVRPDLSLVRPDGLGALAARLDALDTAVPVRLGRLATTIAVTSDAPQTVRRVETTLAVTGATVAAVGAVLLVPAAAVLVAAAGLLADVRVGERRLLRSRGASRRQLALLSLPEGLLGALVVLVAGPVVAGLGYRLLAAQPAMRAAGMPAAVPIGPALPAAAAVALTLLVVILVAGLRPAQDAAAATRRSRVPGVLRSGADVAAVVLAVAAVVRLRLAGPGDAVALAAPALLLLAVVLLGLRLVPLASVLASLVAARSRGAVLALAAWQVGRRAGPSATAVLLVALAVGTGAFGVTELATWRQAQDDQARFALGTGVRAAVGTDVDARERLLAADGAVVAPVERSFGLLQADSGASGSSVQVLGIPAAARGRLAAGRLRAQEGGTIAAALADGPPAAAGPMLPAGTRTVTADAVVQGPDGVAAEVALIAQSPHGLLLPLSAGRLDAGRSARPVRFVLPVDGRGTAPGWRIVGMTATVSAQQPPAVGVPAAATVAVRQPVARGAGGRAIGRLDTAAVDWQAAAGAPGNAQLFAVPERGSGLTLRAELPTDVEAVPAVFSLVGWAPDVILPVVLSGEPGRLVPDGSSLQLLVGATSLPVSRAAAVARVPGSASEEDLAGAGAAPAVDGAVVPTVVIDGTRLARALLTAGASTTAGEWWADVPDARAAALLRALRTQEPDAVATSAGGLTAALQSGPLRVVVQPALLLAVLAGAVLVAVGFAAQAAAVLRGRRVELAQLVALGLPRSRVVGVVALEHVLVCLLGAAIGVAAGLVVAVVTGPALAVAPGGAVPFPPVRVVVPWMSIAVLVAEVVAVLGVVVLVTAQVQRRSAPAELLRAGRDA